MAGCELVRRWLGISGARLGGYWLACCGRVAVVVSSDVVAAIPLLRFSTDISQNLGVLVKVPSIVQNTAKSATVVSDSELLAQLR